MFKINVNVIKKKKYLFFHFSVEGFVIIAQEVLFSIVTIESGIRQVVASFRSRTSISSIVRRFTRFVCSSTRPKLESHCLWRTREALTWGHPSGHQTRRRYSLFTWYRNFIPLIVRCTSYESYVSVASSALTSPSNSPPESISIFKKKKTKERGSKNYD